MLAAANRGVSVESFRKEFGMKDAIYAAAHTRNTGTADTVMHALNNLQPETTFGGNDEPVDDTEG